MRKMSESTPAVVAVVAAVAVVAVAGKEKSSYHSRNTVAAASVGRNFDAAHLDLPHPGSQKRQKKRLLQLDWSFRKMVSL